MRFLVYRRGSYAIWMLCSCFSPCFTIPVRHSLTRNEESLEESKAILSGPQDNTLQFFYPKTCRAKDGQKLESCHEDKDLNQTMCLQFSCCYAPENHKITCYTPLVDTIQLTLRFFIIGIVCLILLGCVPISCCILCQKSKLTNNLQRDNSEVTKILLNHNDTLEKDDMIESLIQEDEKQKMREKKKNRKGRYIR